MISVICPSRGRPKWCRRMYESGLKTQTHDNEYLFYLDENDPELKNYDVPDPFIHKPVGAVIADTILAQRSKHDCILLMGDDAVFATPGWDEKFLAAAQKYPDDIYVIASNDQRVAGNGQHCGHFCVGRGWLKALGSILPPVFVHWYADIWIIYVAKKLGRYEYLDDLVINHYKPHEIGKKDQTWLRLRAVGLKERDYAVDKLSRRYRELDYILLKDAIKKYAKRSD